MYIFITILCCGYYHCHFAFLPVHQVDQTTRLVSILQIHFYLNALEMLMKVMKAMPLNAVDHHH